MWMSIVNKVWYSFCGAFSKSEEINLHRKTKCGTNTSHSAPCTHNIKAKSFRMKSGKITQTSEKIYIKKCVNKSKKRLNRRVQFIYIFMYVYLNNMNEMSLSVSYSVVALFDFFSILFFSIHCFQVFRFHAIYDRFDLACSKKNKQELI